MTADEAHTPYINHVMGCRNCFAPTARYCPTGESLRADYVIAYVMEKPDRLARKRALQVEKDKNPHLFPLIRDRITSLIQAD